MTARQDSGISKRRGEHSGVFFESDEPCAVINPFKEHVWQNGRRIKEPNEPMFTITAQDRHGVLHKGYIRRLTPNISNLYFCVRDKSAELIERLRFVLNSREDFDRIKHIISEKAEIGDVQRAAEFYQLIRYSYASGCDNFGGRPHSMWSNFPLIEQASRRLQRVIIFN